MNRLMTRGSLALFTLVTLAAVPARAGDGDPAILEVRGGRAGFDAATNVSAIRIHGKSDALAGRALVRATAGGLVLERLEALVPVKSLNTGMGMRDEHMQRYVFTTSGGELPDLRFVADNADCSGSDRQSTCRLSGQLTIRGTTRPFAMTLKIAREGSGYHAKGDATVKLSTYGIPAPSQLGVTTEDDVKLFVEFVARPSSGVVGTGGTK